MDDLRQGKAGRNQNHILLAETKGYYPDAFVFKEKLNGVILPRISSRGLKAIVAKELR